MFNNSVMRSDRIYRRRTLVSMAVYVAVNLAALVGLFDAVRGSPLAWVLALAIAVPIAIQIWALMAYMRDADEFIRAVTVKQFTLAAGIAMALFSTWGFAESYANAPHAAGWLIYPLFWLAFGAVSMFVRASHP